MSVAVTVNGCVITGKAQPATATVPKPMHIFYGIPYAQARRFHAAQRVDPPDGGSIDAQRPGPSTPFPSAPHRTSESPLTLTVYRADHGTASSSSSSPTLLPVVVYVHGGGFNFGHPLDRDLGSMLAWAPGRGVLAMAVGYRLGPLGFLSGPDEGEEDVGERNLGLGDQRTAVEWVRRWAGAFGGDAEDITLMGVSAGAHSVGHHILHPSPLPFRKAILESGSATARSTLSAAHPRAIHQLRSLRSLSYDQPLSSIPIEDLLDASLAVFSQQSPSVIWPFQPVVDNRPGSLIPDLPLNLWADLLLRPVSNLAVITGFCSHEGSMFVPQRARTNADFRDFFASLISSLSTEDLDALEALYPDPVTDPASTYAQPAVGRQGPQFRRLYEAYGHYAYICPVLHTAHALSRAGARVYVYEYAPISSPFRTASHCDHAPVVAHDMNTLRYRPGLEAVAKEMNRRWIDFASSPDGDLGNSWPVFKSPLSSEGGSGSLLVFGDGNDEAAGGSSAGTAVHERTLTQREMEQCRFWWDRMELSEGMGEKGVSRLTML